MRQYIVGGGDLNVWYKKFDESTKRQYYEIDNYKIKIPGEDQTFKSDANEDGWKELEQKQIKERKRINDIMETKKQTKCDGACCSSNLPLQESTN